MNRFLTLCLFTFSLLWLTSPSQASQPPTTPTGEIIGYLPISGRALAVQGNIAYVGAESDLVIIDVSDKTSPQEITRLTLSTNILDIAVKDNYAYLATIEGLHLVDISQPTSPQWHSLFNPIPTTKVLLRGDYAYTLTNQGLFILNKTNTPTLTITGHFERAIENPRDLDLVNNYAFIRAGPLSNLLVIVDITDRLHPKEVHSQYDISSQIAVTSNRYLTVDNACSQACITFLSIASWSPDDWEFTYLASSAYLFSGSTRAIATDHIYAYVGKDVGLVNYSIYEEFTAGEPLFVSSFNVGNVNDIAVTNGIIYVVSEDSSVTGSLVEGGLYIVPAPPLYQAYMPFAPVQGSLP